MPRSVCERFLDDVLDGLRRRPRSIPCKYLYDERGSRLFDRICELGDYYLTRAEIAILSTCAADIAAEIGPRTLLVELGSGSSTKSPLLLEALVEPVGYVPIDISEEHLLRAAERTARRLPEIPVLPLVADYTEPFTLPVPERRPRRRALWFPGSTIGNFDPLAATRFLARLRAACGRFGAILIGVDLEKDATTLERAYDDSEGVTAEFNRNLLWRLRKELDASVDPLGFRHLAAWNRERRRIEMHLVSERRQAIRVGGETFRFAPGEAIHTESSYKYSLERFGRIAAAARLEVRKAWFDPAKLFSVQLLVPS